MNQQAMILGLDLGGVIFLAFALISFISWIANQLNSGKAKPPARGQNRPAPRARNQQIQREIDRFLREAAGQNPRPDVNIDEIEIVQSPRRRPPPAKTKAAPRQRLASDAVPKRSSRPRPGERLADRHLAHSTPSLVAVEHPPARGVAAEHLPHAVDASVAAHLGVFSARRPLGTRPATLAGRQAATAIASLRTMQGVRAAIVMQEILQRPRALRQRTHQ